MTRCPVDEMTPCETTVMYCGKPLPTPKAAATPKPILAFNDNGYAVVTLKNEDMPIGPCNVGDLVRVGKAHQKIQDQFVRSLKENLLRGSNAALLDIAGRLGAASTALRAELARCSPPPKPSKKGKKASRHE